MRDDPEYWDALSARIVATVRERRQSSWLRVGVWAPPLATAAALALILANGRAPAAVTPTPSIAALLTAPGQAPSIVAMLAGQP